MVKYYLLVLLSTSFVISISLSSDVKFNCPTTGYFAHPDEPLRCKSYIHCKRNYYGNEKYVPVVKSCPVFTVHTQIKALCQCNEQEISENESTTDLTTEVPTTTSNGNDLPTQNPGFQCPGIGHFPDPENCSNFYQCAEGAEGELIAYKLSCPDPLIFCVFEDGSKACSYKYQCSTGNCGNMKF